MCHVVVDILCAPTEGAVVIAYEIYLNYMLSEVYFELNTWK